MTSGMDAAVTPSQLIYETPAPGVARIVMNRPERRNAQGLVMTYELDAAFRRASHDDDVRVIILAAAGDHFNAGHDLSGEEGWMPDPAQCVGLWGQFDGPGWEGQYSRERETYLDLIERWRNVPKPTIAEVQGSVISGGLMLAWCCDLIVCADDARFRDSTPGELGVPGIEQFQHVFELGARKAKEFLFTGAWMSAQEAERQGMVNHVVNRAELSRFTLDLAKRIATQDLFTLKLVKESVNQAQDAMGRRQAVNFGFAMHQIGHLQNMLRHGFLVDIEKLPVTLRAKAEAFKRAMQEREELNERRRAEQL